MEDTIEAKIINDWLKTQPKIPLSISESLFRLTWAPGELQKRIIHDGINSRVVQERKYPWIGDRWIFEFWIIQPHPDLPDTWNGSYECIYVFENQKTRRSLPLRLDVIQIIVSGLLSPTQSKELIKSRLMDTTKDEKLFDDYFDETTDTSSDIMSNLHFGEGIIVPSEFDVIPPNLRNK